MKTSTNHASLEDWKPFIESIRNGNAQIFEPEPEPKTQAQIDLMELVEAGQFYSDTFKPKERTWKDLSDQEKIAACTHQSGRYKFAKMPNGKVDKFPIFCNLCEQCYLANALKLKEKIDMIDIYAKEKDTEGKGQWRKKTVSDGTEADSLKKRIKRNQDSRHFEVACSDSTNDVYVYVIDEPGKNMDEIYGEPVNLDDIDHNAVYEANRSTGKKMSKGSAFKPGSMPTVEKETIRVMIPQIITQDASRADEVEEILHRTNYIHIAETSEDAKKFYNWQLKYILQELKDANIKILAIEPRFFNFDAQKLLGDWNRNVLHWMSVLASYSEKEEANTDILTKRLYHKVIGEPESLENWMN